MLSVAPSRRKFIDADVFVIGGGPSLRDFDWTKLHDKNTIGCNAAYLLGGAACSLCFFSDALWFQANRAGLESYNGTVVTHSPDLGSDRPAWVYYMQRACEPGLYKHILGGGNSGSAAINLALIMGARRVLLLGFDGALSSKGKANWHDTHTDKPDAAVYPYFDQEHAAIARTLPSEFPGRQVINLNPNSTIEHFPKAQLSDFL